MNRNTVNALLEKYGGESQYQQSPNWSKYPTRSRISLQSDNSHQQQCMPSASSRYIDNQLGAFMMSRSQCQQFLDRIKQQLKYQQTQLQGFSQHSIRHLHTKFQQNHQKIRDLLLNLLQKAFIKNQQQITQQLKKHHETYPKEFNHVYDQIKCLENELQHFKNGLKSYEYKNAIVRIIGRDFPMEIRNIHLIAKQAKNCYLRSMGEVEPDRQRIQCIKDDLQRLFRINKKSLNQSNFKNLKTNAPRASQSKTQQPLNTQNKQNNKQNPGFIRSIFKFC